MEYDEYLQPLFDMAGRILMVAEIPDSLKTAISDLDWSIQMANDNIADARLRSSQVLAVILSTWLKENPKD